MTRPMVERICKCGRRSVVAKWKIDHDMNLMCRSCATTQSNTRHGGKGTATYGSWLSMRQRCLNANCKDFKYWGGRGITICKRWDLYENFLADMGERPEGKTIDRIDPNGHYEPMNCRWATPAEQTGNRRPLIGTRLRDDINK